MMSRSNSARAPKMWNTSFPPLVVVSMFSLRLLKPTPRSARPETVVMRWVMDLPSLSKRQTTRVSPLPEVGKGDF